jgi:DNA adenine methylase
LTDENWQKLLDNNEEVHPLIMDTVNYGSRAGKFVQTGEGKNIKPTITGMGLNAIIGRVGGKKLLKKRIVDNYFPKNYEQMTYVEPFIGGGSIFFYKKPSIKEIINDKDTNVYNIFRGFQNFNGNLISKDINGKYNKNDYIKILNEKPKSEYNKFIRLLKLFRLSFFGDINSPSYGGEDKISSNFGDKYQDRLKDTLIRNTDFSNLVKKYDSDNTFFYLDPPYEESEGLYKYDTLNIKQIYDIIKNIKGKFLLSYNNSEEAKKLFKNYNINTIKTKYTNPKKGSQDRVVKELLISNYPIQNKKGGSGQNKFMNQLNNLNISPDKYLKIAKSTAKQAGYNPKNLYFSDKINSKLMIKNDEGKFIHFGKPNYNDYIIWSLLEKLKKVPKGYADKKRNVFQKSHSKIKGDWINDKFSPNMLALKINW